MPLNNRNQSRKKLLIIQRKQFGYLTDTFKVAHNLKDEFDIFFICFSGNQPIMESSGINLIYVNHSGNFFLRGIRLILSSISYIRSIKPDYIFIVYFAFCSLIPLLTCKKCILDFRTGSVHKNNQIRVFSDTFATIESFFFHRISIISEGLMRHLKINRNKAFILPLGADSISSIPKIFDKPRLLYIGTFHNRNLEQTIQGLSIFLKQHPECKETISYDIIGDGWHGEENKLKKESTDLLLHENIRFHGRLSHYEAKHFFDTCNIGISYVPKTEYFDHQPPTKTFEYVLSGMPVIATSTSEHKKIIDDSNGMLCDDSPESFATALRHCIFNFDKYNEEAIREGFSNYTWVKISQQLKENIYNGK